MNGEELLRMIDIIHTNKDIPREVIFRGLEEALAGGVRRRLGVGEELVVNIDRETAEVTIEDDEEVYEFDLSELGRIAAQAVKQGFMQRVREAERDVLFEEYEARVGTLVNGVVQRYEGNDLVINLGKVEAYLNREERVRGETYGAGDRIRAIVDGWMRSPLSSSMTALMREPRTPTQAPMQSILGSEERTAIFVR